MAQMCHPLLVGKYLYLLSSILAHELSSLRILPTFYIFKLAIAKLSVYCRSALYRDPYSPTLLPHHLLQGRVTTRIEETSPPLQIRSSTSAASAAAYGRAGSTIYSIKESSPPLQRPLNSAASHGRVVATLRGGLQVPPTSAAAYGRVGLNSYTTNTADRQPTRSQVRFDPFTGEPYKFDPFTGEPIRPDSSYPHS